MEVIDLRDGPRLRVLVVDDDIVVPTLLAIERADLMVDEVHRAAMVPMAARAATPDAVVVDRWMPDGDGLDVVRWLRQFPATRRIPIVVALTGADEIEDADVVRAGADACLRKPFDSDLVATTLRRLVDTPTAELRVRRVHRLRVVSAGGDAASIADVFEQGPPAVDHPRHWWRRTPPGPSLRAR